MRFTAPERADLDATVFAHPVFDTLEQAHLALCRQPQWPEVDELNALWQAPENRFGNPYRFVAQETLADGLHYEQRIFEQGLIATRQPQLARSVQCLHLDALSAHQGGLERRASARTSPRSAPSNAPAANAR